LTLRTRRRLRRDANPNRKRNLRRKKLRAASLLRRGAQRPAKRLVKDGVRGDGAVDAAVEAVAASKP